MCLVLFFNDTATTEIYTLSLHDALPICAAFFGLHRPAEPDGMVFRHVAAHDQDRVRVGQILLEGGRPTSAKACPQTGDGGALSYSALVFDRDDAQAAAEQLLDQVAFLDVHRGAPAAGHRG